ncbi:hypothetical protein GGF31_003800 [Allomyces arbusculus]|nr:hypothetical protein GGF31_003800 [Allomyces arbusculus]
MDRIVDFFSAVLGMRARDRQINDHDSVHQLDAATRGRPTGATRSTENDVIQGADPNATGRIVQEASASSPSWATIVRGAPANPTDTSLPASTTTPARSTWNSRSDRASADAETIDRALTNASNALKSLIVQVLGEKSNHNARKALVARTKKLIRADLESMLGSNRDGEHAPSINLVLVAWRMEHARAVIGSTVLLSACTALRKHWDRQQTALSGGGRRGSSGESDATLWYWLDLAIRALRDVAERYDHDPAVRQHAAKSKDPIRVFFAVLAQDKKPNMGLDALMSVVGDVLMTMLGELKNIFNLTLLQQDFPTLIRCVALPLVECFLLTKTLDSTWDFQFMPLGMSFSSRSMVDPPLEVEWHVGERDVPARGRGLVETKVVLLTTFPGIPFRFGVAETVLHRAEVLVVPVSAPAPTPPPSAAVPALADPVQNEKLRAALVDPILEPFAPAHARIPTPPAAPTLAPAMEPAMEHTMEPAMEPAYSVQSPTLAPITFVSPVLLPRPTSAPPTMMTTSVQTDAAETPSVSWATICAGDLHTFTANLYELMATPVILNQPPGYYDLSTHWPRVHMTAGTIARFIDLFHRIASNPNTDLHDELAKADNRLALLRAEMVDATLANRVSHRLQAFIDDHKPNINWALGDLKYTPSCPRWEVPFVHNLYQWFRLVLVARMAGHMLVVPRRGEPHNGQIACLAHNIRDCGYKVGVALGPSLVSITDGLPVCDVPLFPGYCDRAVPN